MKQDVLSFFIPALFFSLLGYFLQTQLIFSPDVGYLLQAANRMLAGGNYVNEIFETNPPMILYLYFPVCLLAKITKIDYIIVARLYIIFLSVISTGCCYLLLKKIIQPEDRQYNIIFICTLFFILLLLPVNAILQREHMLLIVLLPYLLAAALALENKPIHPIAAIFIGLFAGVGFALKPFFLLPLCLIESLFIIKKRSLFAWVRIESVMILIVFIVYLSSVCLLQPDYINVILPFTFHYYFPFIKKSWEVILTIPYVSICLAVIVSYLFIQRYDKYKTIGTVLFTGLLGMTAAFLIPRAAWYYHVLPAFGLAVLIVMHLFSQAVDDRGYVLPVLLVAIVLFYPLQNSAIVYCYMYALANDKTYTLNRLSAYLNSFPGKHSVFCFTAGGTTNCFPIVHPTQSDYAERFPSFWWYTGVRFKEQYSVNMQIAHQASRDKQYLINCIAEDLNRYQARWIVIDENSFKPVEKEGFNLIASLSENPNFWNAWQHYRYLSHFDNFTIYERIPEKQNG